MKSNPTTKNIEPLQKPIELSTKNQKSSIARPVLTLIQKTIQQLGHLKSSFVAKIKATVKPISAFLCKEFYNRLENALKRVGLFSSHKTEPSKPLLIHEPSQETISAVIYEETKPLSNTNIANLANTVTSSKELGKFAFAQLEKKPYVLRHKQTAPIAYKEEVLRIVSQIAEVETVSKPLKELVPFPKSTLSNPLSAKLPILAKEKVHKKLPTIIEESSLSILLGRFSDIEKQKITSKEFFNLASEVFGDSPIKRVQSWKKFKLPEIFQQGDILHALAAIGHAITLDDLTNLLNRVREGTVSLELSSTEQDISKLPAKDIKKLVAFFRNPLQHLQPNEAKVLWEELEAIKHPIDSKRIAYTKYEYFIHQLTEEAKTLNSEKEKEVLSFASSEQLAKFIGYAKPDTLCKGMIIPVFAKYDIEYYILENHVNKEGLHCCLFTPLNKNLHLPAQLIFRGTDGINSMNRDVFDTQGIGKSIFDKCAPEIAKMINSYCSSNTNPALEICGHSLGAADAQRATILCTSLFNDPFLLKTAGLCNESFAPIAFLSRISCSAFCSPKLDAPTIALWKREIEKLSNSQLKLELKFAYHESDLVTWAGHKALFIPDDLVANANLQATYLHVKSLSSGCIKTLTHHRQAFFKGARFDYSTDERSYLLYKEARYLYQLQEKYTALRTLSEQQEGSFIVLSEEMPEEEDGSFILINPTEDDKQAAGLNEEIHTLLKKKTIIERAQTGFSPEDSPIFSFADKALIPMREAANYWFSPQEINLPSL